MCFINMSSNLTLHMSPTWVLLFSQKLQHQCTLVFIDAAFYNEMLLFAGIPSPPRSPAN